MAGDCGEVMASRAKSCPLIVVRTLHSYRDLGPSRKFLQDNLARIEQLNLNAPDGFIHALLTNASLLLSTPMLTSLILSSAYYCETEDNEIDEEFAETSHSFPAIHDTEFLTPTSFGGSACKLTKLVLDELPYPGGLPFFLNLTHLSIIDPTKFYDHPSPFFLRLVDILRCTPLLQALVLRNAAHHLNDDDTRSYPGPTIIHLPHLMTLEIEDNAHGCALLSSVLSVSPSTLSRIRIHLRNLDSEDSNDVENLARDLLPSWQSLRAFYIFGHSRFLGWHEVDVINPNKQIGPSSNEDAFRFPYNIECDVTLKRDLEDINEQEALIARSLFRSLIMTGVVELHLHYDDDTPWDIETITVWLKAFPNVEHLSLRSYFVHFVSPELLCAIVLSKNEPYSVQTNNLSFPRLTTLTVSASLFSRRLQEELPVTLKERSRLHPQAVLQTLILCRCRNKVDARLIESLHSIVPHVYWDDD